ncbi:MAG: hypothetical protein QOH52_3761, partial [Pseudonocardiales bacterium]|nr:hypothetical protein [Pseudonocardiales bacterium]
RDLDFDAGYQALRALGRLLLAEPEDELATGGPPFGTGDPLRLMHDHLARVPVPPTEVNRAVPGSLSEIIMHLLEKEPENRYQTADGLLYDLERLSDADARAAGDLRIGELDLPLLLLPPSRLVGRDAEVAALRAAFEEALTGGCRGVLVGGAPGVGKTALVHELRPVVTAADGWFVAGKFDQYRRDLDFDAGYQALRALGRLLLAEPEDELAKIREKIVSALGPNAGLLTAIVPELAALLAVAPDRGDPLTAQARTQRAAVAMLSAVASRKRPVVMFLDDLQWTGRTPLGFVDLVLSEEPIDGLLLVAAYRDADVTETHLLAAPLSRWQAQAGVEHLRLDNLSVPSVVTMVAEMLHADPATAAGLVDVIGPHLTGNPYETVELLNLLRGDGLLTATATGWQRDAVAVRAQLGRSEVAELAAARVENLPPGSRAMVEAMACLGGRAEFSVLQTATGEPANEVARGLAPAVDAGLLVVEPEAHKTVRFRHDRIHEAIRGGLDPRRRGALQLGLARRLAGVPELFAAAAEQYLPVVDAVDDAAERRQVVGLLRCAADQAALIGDHALVDALLGAAPQLIDPGDTETLIEVHISRHAALFSLGRLEEADAVYRTIESLCPTASPRAGATCVQVHSLTHRQRYAEARALGFQSLSELGITVPAAAQLAAELDRQFDHLYRWLDHTDAADDLVRPEITDPTLLATAGLLNAILPTVYVTGDHATHAWLSLEGARIWLQYGPTRSLVGPASHTAFAAVALRGDYSAGYRALRRIVALGEARGYEPDTSSARHLFALLSWCSEPIENGVHASQQARHGLIAGGDLAYAAYTYYPTAYHLLDYEPSLDIFVAEVEAGLAFARRTGSDQVAQWLDSYRWLAGVLRGESSAAAGEAIPADRYADNPQATLYAHMARAIAAAVFDDAIGLARQTAAAMPLLPTALGFYPTVVARLLRGLALAGQARTTRGDEHGDLLTDLDELTQWLATRAQDAPDNVLHLLRLLEAERAWAVGDFRAAALAFDAARRESAGRPRPWHRALITERAARFHLANGLEQSGSDLLAQARQEYAGWGATAKVAQLDWAYPTLRPQPDAAVEDHSDQSAVPPHGRSAVTTGTVDLLGILSTSQALSSETSIERLHARVAEVLGAMTGATDVHLLPWSEDRQDWLRPTPRGTAPASSGTGHKTTVPMTVLRYVRRTAEPLVVADATRDDRFARDPYFTDVHGCSLLAIPILSRGTLRAVLLLENRLLHGAFTTNRLDAVKLIASQLAVSLDNAQLYTELTASRARIVAAADTTRRRIERDLHDGAQQRLVSLALQLRRTVTAPPLPEADELAARMNQVADGLIEVLDELREIAGGLHPAALAGGGLRPALKTLGRRSAVPVRLDLSVEERLPEPVELAAYYVVAEALTNAAKHAQASVVDVGVTAGARLLRIRVRDDGIGGADLAGGSGLVGLKDRVEALGGRLALNSPIGAGTVLDIAVPLDTPGRPGQLSR